MTDSATVFRPTREHVLAIILMTGVALIGIAWSPFILGWVLIVPIVYLAWVFSVRSTISSEGIAVKYLMRSDASLQWDDLSGVAFKGARALATTKDGKEYPLPGVTFNDIPELSEASSGRITDVITESAEAADGKYEIIDKEGNKVLLSREEYDDYLQTHPGTPGPRPESTTKEQ